MPAPRCSRGLAETTLPVRQGPRAVLDRDACITNDTVVFTAFVARLGRRCVPFLKNISFEEPAALSFRPRIDVTLSDEVRTIPFDLDTPARLSNSL